MVEPIQQSNLDRMIGTSGMIRDLIRFPRSPLDLPLHVVTARLQDSLESGLSESVARCVASGVSEDPQLAAASAIGEAWERIAFVQQCNKLAHAASISTAMPLSGSDLFELPYLLDKGTDRRQWAAKAASSPYKVMGYMEYFEDMEPQACELPVWAATPEESSTLFETTNGLACADSFMVALDRAVREVVERDALMLVWLTQCGGKRVSPAQYLSPVQCKQISRLSDMRIQFRLRDISTEFGISVFLAVIYASFPGDRVGISFGSGAHRLPEIAARHAFREAGLSWRGVAWRSLRGEHPEHEDMKPKSFAEHTEYYSSWKRMHLLDFLLADDPIDDTELADQKETIVINNDSGHIELLHQRGRRILAKDITPGEAIGSGLVVVQAIIPGLVPLYIADRCADELVLKRLPAQIGGYKQYCPGILNARVHPWP